MISIRWQQAIVGFIVIAGVALATYGQSKDSPLPSDAEQAIRARLAEIQAAAQALDPEKVFSFVMENDKGALIQNGELLLTRGAALASTKRGLRGLEKVSYQFDQQHITFLSPTVALAVGEGVSSATTDDGRTIRTRFAQSVVLKLVDGEWSVFHAHRSFPAAR